MCTDSEKSSLLIRWEQTETALDDLFEQDKKITLPIADKLEEIRKILGQSAGKIVLSTIEPKIQWVEDWVNATPGEKLWEDYFTAYDAMMKVTGRSDNTWTRWVQAIHNFEGEINDAKENGGGGLYREVRLQRFYSRLKSMGLTPPAAGPDPVIAARDSLLQAANTRFSAFSGDGSMNRGAWAGSNSHGARPVNYARTNDEVIHAFLELSRSNHGRLNSNWWIMRSDSAPTGYALHRGGIDDRGDFIYHL